MKEQNYKSFLILDNHSYCYYVYKPYKQPIFFYIHSRYFPSFNDMVIYIINKLHKRKNEF